MGEESPWKTMYNSDGELEGELEEMESSSETVASVLEGFANTEMETSEENLIHASIWSNIVPKFKSLFHEGVLYDIKNFKVVPSIGNFRPLANDTKIIFQKFTSVKKLEEGIVDILQNGFQFISAGLVHSRVNDSRVNDDIVLSGVVYFATTSASKIFINLKISYVSSLIEIFTTVSNEVQFLQNKGEKKDHDEDMLLERMMISDLLSATWDKDTKVSFIIVRGTITSIISSLGWFYKGCKACYKQLTTIDDGYYCRNCKVESEFPLVLYKIHIRIKDKTGETSYVLFNMVAERVLDTLAHKLLNKQPIDSVDIPSEVQTLTGKEYVFKLKLNEYNIMHGREDFTMVSLWIPDDQVEKDCEIESVGKVEVLSSKDKTTTQKVGKSISKDLEGSSVASVEEVEDEITSDDESQIKKRKRKRVVEEDDEGF